jgi:hypothetical protein
LSRRLLEYTMRFFATVIAIAALASEALAVSCYAGYYYCGWYLINNAGK